MARSQLDVAVTIQPPTSAACAEVGCPGCNGFHWIVTAKTDPPVKKGPSHNRATAPRRNR